MKEPIIKVEGLSKKYIIGHQKRKSYTALRDVITHGVKNVMRKGRNIISGKQIEIGSSFEEFWAQTDCFGWWCYRYDWRSFGEIG